MLEAETYLSPQSENFITRANYNPKFKGLFGMAFFGIPALAIHRFESSSLGVSLPQFMRGRLFDVMATPTMASFGKVLAGDRFVLGLTSSILTSTLIEVGQKIGATWGTYDAGDLAAYLIGGVIWSGFEGTAKLIHDSGFSLPIYRALGIQHRKFG